MPMADNIQKITSVLDSLPGKACRLNETTVVRPCY